VRACIAVAGCIPALGSAPQAYSSYFATNGVLKFPYGYSNARVECRPLVVCDVMLASQENVLNVAVGDSVRWIVASASSGPGGTTPHVFIKPTQFDLETNLVITTTRHTYYIDLVSSRDGGAARIAFYYPDEEREARRNALYLARLEAARALITPSPTPVPPQLSFAYRMYGEPSILPRTVYNDGTHVYLQYDKLPADLPVPYAITASGTEQTSNYRVLGTTIVIDGLLSGVDLVSNIGVGLHGKTDLRAYIRRT